MYIISVYMHNILLSSEELVLLTVLLYMFQWIEHENVLQAFSTKHQSLPKNEVTVTCCPAAFSPPCRAQIPAKTLFVYQVQEKNEYSCDLEVSKARNKVATYIM